MEKLRESELLRRVRRGDTLQSSPTSTRPHCTRACVCDCHRSKPGHRPSPLSLSDMALHSLTLSSLPGASLILLVSFLLWHLRTRQASGASHSSHSGCATFSMPSPTHHRPHCSLIGSMSGISWCSSLHLSQHHSSLTRLLS